MFTTKKVRTALVAVGVGAALASGALAAAGTDISPWSTTHGQVVMADGAGPGKAAFNTFSVTKKIDKASVTLP
jgi:hypothetical protein